MITSDPQLRATRLREVMALLDRDGDDRQLHLAFANTVFPELPDTVALRLDSAALAADLRDYFRFVAHTMPPPDQLYKGLPGLHVAVRNRPGDDDATIIETHTPHVPFVFESVKNYIQRQGLRVFSAIQPVFTVRRQWERISSIGGPIEDGPRELYCRFRVERVEPPDRLRRIEHQVFAVLKTVFLAVEDFGAMMATVRDLASRVTSRRGNPSEVATTRAFLGWLVDNNYVFLGLAHYRSDGTRLHADAECALGLFKDPALIPVVYAGLPERQERLVQRGEGDDRILSIDYCAGVTALHQVDPLDDIVIQEWTREGRPAATTWLVGRFSRNVLSASAEKIPLLDGKLAWLLEHSGAAPISHAQRETRAIFNRFPKRELFYAGEASIKDILDRMVYVSSDDEVAVALRTGAGYQAVCAAFASIHYSHQAAEQLTRWLIEAFGPIFSHTSTDCGSMTLLVFYFDAAALTHPIDRDRVRAIVRDVITKWEDRAASALESEYGATEGRRLFRKYIDERARSGLYRETTPPEQVPEDIRRLDRLESRLEVRVIPESAESVTVKLFSPTPLDLVATIRTCEHLGLNVREQLTIPVLLPDGRRAFIERLRIEAAPQVVQSVSAGCDDLFLDAIRALQEGAATNDALNGLVLNLRLGWRDVELLRTLRNHLVQIRPHYTADTINFVLLRNGLVARALFHAFAARFDPAIDERDPAIKQADGALADVRRQVASLLDDEILQSLENLMRAAVRTNFYQRPERPVLSIKVECARVDRMVSPRPLFEIYVHSRLLEGIHLRGGRVARGGLRWSDRHDDFRTEVLGLMQTQMLKNSIIVPVGSKGGFVLKGHLPARPALDAYLIDRYREFISGLLDVTDTIVENGVMHPPAVVRYDGDDPYLVVAADKGTAHLSDTANQVSQQYGFWLGDAFASGGTHGYDHKKQAITARGAWVSVRSHFRYLGIDADDRPFTVVGIGDMSGDVFGNGMLQSRKIALLAAFNAQHILIDPHPDPERSFVERERLFHLPRSTWRDYDGAAFGQGGGVYDRQARSVPLSPEARRWLELGDEPVTGEEVIRRILTAPVDLLYNGGIGTYVKASGETEAEVGDRTNDRVRVNAAELRARVVAEGGNLGLTQKARIEYWGRGGCVNTDAVDNSGGVDMSDHEVNIKILLDLLSNRGVLSGRMERNELLVQMSEAVAELVLQDNADQARALDLDGLRSVTRYEAFVALIDDLIAAGVMHRVADGVPARDELMALSTSGRGIPRPLLAVTLGHVKNWAYAQVLESPLVDSPAAARFLNAYFPPQLQQRFSGDFALHPLRREIVATGAVNGVINQAGVGFLARMMAATKKDAGAVITAYLEAETRTGAGDRRAQALAAHVEPLRELEALLQIEEALEAATVESTKFKVQTTK
jgi:glutamate dehydrogenase